MRQNDSPNRDVIDRTVQFQLDEYRILGYHTEAELVKRIQVGRETQVIKHYQLENISWESKIMLLDLVEELILYIEGDRSREEFLKLSELYTEVLVYAGKFPEREERQGILNSLAIVARNMADGKLQRMALVHMQQGRIQILGTYAKAILEFREPLSPVDPITGKGGVPAFMFDKSKAAKFSEMKDECGLKGLLAEGRRGRQPKDSVEKS